MHHVTEGYAIRVEDTLMDTAKEFGIGELITKRFGGEEDWVKAWIKAAARELSKTTPLHVDAHRIYHTVVRSRNVIKKGFRTTESRAMDRGKWSYRKLRLIY